MGFNPWYTCWIKHNSQLLVYLFLTDNLKGLLQVYSLLLWDPIGYSRSAGNSFFQAVILEHMCLFFSFTPGHGIFNSLTRDRTCAPCSGINGALTIGPPGMMPPTSMSFYICISIILTHCFHMLKIELHGLHVRNVIGFIQWFMNLAAANLADRKELRGAIWNERFF